MLGNCKFYNEKKGKFKDPLQSMLFICFQFQSIIYLVFSVIGILISNGNYSMKDYKFNYLLYLAYFRGEALEVGQ